jgi:hypothetical protein
VFVGRRLRAAAGGGNAALGPRCVPHHFELYTFVYVYASV